MPETPILVPVNDPPISLSRDYNPLVATVKQLATANSNPQWRHPRPQYWATETVDADYDQYSLHAFTLSGEFEPKASLSAPQKGSELFCVNDLYELKSGTTGHVRMIGVDYPALVRASSTDPPTAGNPCGIKENGDRFVSANETGFICMSSPVNNRCWVARRIVEKPTSAGILLEVLDGNSAVADRLDWNYSVVIEQNVTVYHHGNIFKGASDGAHILLEWENGRWEVKGSGC